MSHICSCDIVLLAKSAYASKTITDLSPYFVMTYSAYSSYSSPYVESVDFMQKITSINSVYGIFMCRINIVNTLFINGSYHEFLCFLTIPCLKRNVGSGASSKKKNGSLSWLLLVRREYIRININVLTPYSPSAFLELLKEIILSLRLS